MWGKQPRPAVPVDISGPPVVHSVNITSNHAPLQYYQGVTALTG